MLILPIKKKWFEMIISGEKKEEYREIKPYYQTRFLSHFDREKDMITVIFRNGYGKNVPSIKCECELTTGYGKEEWGAEKGKKYYVLKIVEVKRI